MNEDGKKIVGHAAVFNSLSLEMWGFRERIMPGAFKRVLSEGADVRALINHNPSTVLGRSKAGTLALREDGQGLLAKIDPPDTTAAKDIIESISRGDVDGMSIGFRSVDERWIREGGANVRELLDVDLFDVSIATYPAYPATEVIFRTEIRRFKMFIPTPKLNRARMQLRDIKDSGTPRLARAADRHNRLMNSDRYRRLIELRDAGADAEEVRDLNLYTSHLAAFEDLCLGAQKICRRLYGQNAGFFDTRVCRVEHSISSH
jgi:hypothetical protein